jgi:hypothetical protein
VAEFELHVDKIYKWVASSIAEKNAFILSVWKVKVCFILNFNSQIFMIVVLSFVTDSE